MSALPLIAAAKGKQGSLLHEQFRVTEAIRERWTLRLNCSNRGGSVYSLLCVLALVGPIAPLLEVPGVISLASADDENDGTDVGDPALAGLPFSRLRAPTAGAGTDTTFVQTTPNRNFQFQMPDSTPTVGAFAKRNGLGSPMRC
jgi:hypothetical protein